MKSSRKPLTSETRPCSVQNMSYEPMSHSEFKFERDVARLTEDSDRFDIALLRYEVYPLSVIDIVKVGGWAEWKPMLRQALGYREFEVGPQ